MKKTDFNKKLAQLEEIVKKLQKDDLSLEQSLEYFEQGVKIHKYCKKAIEDAKLRVETLTNSSNELFDEDKHS